MKGTLHYRLVCALVVCLAGMAWLLPSVLPPDSSLRKFLPDDHINLGLDLKGGVHLTLEVDIAQAIQYNLQQTGNDLRSFARDEKLVVLKPEVTPDERLTFILLKKEQQAQFDTLLRTAMPALETLSTEALDVDKVRYTMGYTPQKRAELADLTVEQALRTIRNRVDQFGVAEPDIRKQQNGRLQIQLPGLADPQRAVAVIAKTAHLEFKLVDDLTDPATAVLPPGRERATLRSLTPQNTYLESPVILHKETLLTGEYITTANVNYDQFGQPYVSLTFNGAGGRKFATITEKYLQKRLAIVLDGAVYSAPVIRDKIVGGHAQISGSFTDQEASDLALQLRSGALPAPVSVLEERSVGPSLGQESIDKGISAAVAGFVLVLIFMIFYYGFGGLIADIALLITVVLVMGGLAGFGATLTLPGIAGIILTIGMAVDANVIIFERIREELRRGSTRREAVRDGFERATLTILDANVTTVFAAAILYQFGSGPVRGFAVTLILGILASLFTAIFVSRIFFDMFSTIQKPVAGLRFIRPDTRIAFISRRKVAFALSGLVLLIGLVSLALQGGPRYGVDFAGGITIQVRFDSPAEPSVIKTALEQAGVTDIAVQTLGLQADNEFILRTAAVEKGTGAVRDIVHGALSASSLGAFEIQRQEMVGPKVGADLRTQALEALFYAVLLIAIYISGRFEARWMTAGIMAAGLALGIYVLNLLAIPMGMLIVAAMFITVGLCWYLKLNYALGAVVALIHDVLITVGIFSLLGKEFDLSIVAALLTIVGYSLNDTIIIFDRIRENLRGQKNPDLPAVLNRSINQTLSRTLLTSCTTLFVVLALVLFGGGVIHDFAVALFIGILVGTYSSIFVASPILLGFGPTVKEEQAGAAVQQA